MSEKLYLLADKILHFTFYILLFTVPLVFLPQNYELFEFNKMMLTYALAVVIVACWALKCIIAGKLIFRRTLLFLPLLLFLLSQILSTIGSIDIHTSIWGYYTRSNGGVLSTITYIALYWAFVSNMTPKAAVRSVKYLLSSAVIISFWGILEHFGRSPSCLLLTGNFDASCWVQDVQTRVFATLGQPNWMAAWLVAVAPLSWALVLTNKDYLITNKFGKLLLNSYYLIVIILFLALLFTKSRSGLLGFAAASAVFWTTVAWVNRKKLSNIIRPALLLNTYYLILILIFGTPWTPSILGQNAKSKTQNIETGTVLERGGTESGEIRKIVWKGALDIWRAYPLTGSGVETFAYSYYNFRPVEHNLTSEWNFLYNKAHNEYLNFLATTGVFGLAAYFILIGSVLSLFLRSIKYEVISNRSEKLILNNYYLMASILAGFASILVTNFFGFSVVPVAFLFFLYPAMAVTLSIKEELITNKFRKLEPNNYSLLFIPIILLITYYLLLRIFHLWYADTLFNQADKLIKSDESVGAAEKLERAVALRRGEPNYHDKLATAYSTTAVTFAEENNTQKAQEYADLAKQETDKAYAISPRNISILKSRASTFNRLASVDSIYLTYAVLTLERAATFAPTDPITNYNLGVALYRRGETARAVETLEKLNEMKPDYADSRFALAEIYILEGEKQKAKGEFEYILKNIDPESEFAGSALNELNKR